MKNVYLDHNIYIHLLNGTIDKREVKEYLNTNKAKYLFSPAHIEELYLAGTVSKMTHMLKKY